MDRLWVMRWGKNECILINYNNIDDKIRRRKLLRKKVHSECDKKTNSVSSFTVFSSISTASGNVEESEQTICGCLFGRVNLKGRESPFWVSFIPLFEGFSYRVWRRFFCTRRFQSKSLSASIFTFFMIETRNRITKLFLYKSITALSVSVSWKSEKKIAVSVCLADLGHLKSDISCSWN